MSPAFLTDLQRVYATLHPRAFSRVFEADLRRVYATLPGVSDDALNVLAGRFCAWRQTTEENVRRWLGAIPDDDPLRCPISLFGTLDYGRLETAHTRALAWLLDPSREHGFDRAILRSLFRHLGVTRDFRVDQIASEYPIEGGRVDILAEGAWTDDGCGWVLLIEAKVDAGEGQNQLRRYKDWMQQYATGRDEFRIFLTPDGRTPDTGDDDWALLSYPQLVTVIRSVYDGLRDTAGFHYLRFYLAGVLQDICHWPRGMQGHVADPYAVADYLRTSEAVIGDEVTR